MSHAETNNKSGFATAGLVLGIIGICTSFIPIINNLSFFLGLLAIIFAIVSLVKKASKGKAVASIILGILTIVITLSVQKTVSDALDVASQELDKATGSSTEEVLKNDVNVELGNFEATTGDYGITETEMTVKVTNKTNETKSFTIQVEAVGEDGSRIASDYVYANNLTAGQSQDFKIFEYVQEDNLEKMKNAKFNIVEASMY